MPDPIPVTFNQAGDPTYDPAPQVSQQTTAQNATPVITWSNPADIFWGTLLSATQLNAAANADGSFAYKLGKLETETGNWGQT